MQRFRNGYLVYWLSSEVKTLGVLWDSMVGSMMRSSVKLECLQYLLRSSVVKAAGVLYRAGLWKPVTPSMWLILVGPALLSCSSLSSDISTLPVSGWGETKEVSSCSALKDWRSWLVTPFALLFVARGTLLGWGILCWSWRIG